MKKSILKTLLLNAAILAVNSPSLALRENGIKQKKSQYMKGKQFKN